MNEVDHFLQFDYFDDEITVGLIMAASKCLSEYSSVAILASMSLPFFMKQTTTDDTETERERE